MHDIIMQALTANISLYEVCSLTITSKLDTSWSHALFYIDTVYVILDTVIHVNKTNNQLTSLIYHFHLIKSQKDILHGEIISNHLTHIKLYLLFKYLLYLLSEELEHILHFGLEMLLHNEHLRAVTLHLYLIEPIICNQIKRLNS